MNQHLIKIVKTKQNKKEVPVIRSEELAQLFKDTYEAFCNKGFTTEQAFELLLAVTKKQFKAKIL